MASKSSDVRPKITLACVDCKERNYITKKNRRNDPDRMELSKFCPRCRKHTEHRETALTPVGPPDLQRPDRPGSLVGSPGRCRFSGPGGCGFIKV